MVHESIAEGSRLTYQKGWNKWTSYCDDNGIDRNLTIIPWDYGVRPRLFIFEVAAVIAFMVYCFYVLQLAASTIDNYLFGIRFHLKASGRDCDFLQSYPLLQAKKALSIQCRQRKAVSETGSLPVSMAMIQKYKQRKSTEVMENHGIFVALILAFTLLLHISEYTVVPNANQMPHHLRAQDIIFTVDGVQIPSHIFKKGHSRLMTGVTIKLRSCKNDQGGIGHTFSFQRRNVVQENTQCLCFILAQWAIRARLSENDLFLSYRQQWQVTPAKVSTAVKFMARMEGFDEKRFSSHSLRYGGATALAAAGTPDSWIQTFGRWRSLAFLKYIKLSGRIFQQIQNVVMNESTVTTQDIATLLA